MWFKVGLSCYNWLEYSVCAQADVLHVRVLFYAHTHTHLGGIKKKMISLISLHTLPLSTLCVHPWDTSLQVNFNVPAHDKLTAGAAICPHCHAHLHTAVCRCACAPGVYIMRAVIGGGPAGSSVWCHRGSLWPGPGVSARSVISQIRRIHLAAPGSAAYRRPHPFPSISRSFLFSPGSLCAVCSVLISWRTITRRENNACGFGPYGGGWTKERKHSQTRAQSRAFWDICSSGTLEGSTGAYMHWTGEKVHPAIRHWRGIMGRKGLVLPPFFIFCWAAAWNVRT